MPGAPDQALRLPAAVDVTAPVITGFALPWDPTPPPLPHYKTWSS
jgi:hypothetical protein